jgi:seryl-tRNA synthetase
LFYYDRERLQGELEKLQCDLRAKVQETEELRATKNVAEEKLASARKDANFLAAEALEDSKELAQQLKEARLQSDQLLAQVK